MNAHGVSSSELSLTKAECVVSFQSYSLVTLVDIMNDSKIHGFIKVVRAIDSFRLVLEELQRRNMPMGEEFKKATIGYLAKIKAGCRECHLEHTSDQIDRIKRELGSVTYGQLQGYLDASVDRIEDETSKHLFLIVPKDMAKLFRTPKPFGSQFYMKMPRARYDAREVAACLALDRYTASVFHVSRLFEIVSIRLAKMVKYTPAPNQTMGVLVAEVIRIIDRDFNPTGQVNPRRKEKFVKMSDMAGFLRSVVRAWRNPTMHVESNYSRKHALRIVNATEGFIDLFAELI